MLSAETLVGHPLGNLTACRALWGTNWKPHGGGVRLLRGKRGDSACHAEGQISSGKEGKLVVEFEKLLWPVTRQDKWRNKVSKGEAILKSLLLAVFCAKARDSVCFELNSCQGHSGLERFFVCFFSYSHLLMRKQCPVLTNLSLLQHQC